MQHQHKRELLIRWRKAFTLVEVLAAAAIFAVLVGVVWLALAGRVKVAAKQAALRSDMRQLVAAVNIYRADNDDGLPSNWRSFGCYGVNRKDKFGPGFPPRDVYYDKPPEYDVSYDTPGCQASPSAKMTFFLFRQIVEQYNSRPRFNPLDIEHTSAFRFNPACLASSIGTRPLTLFRSGAVATVTLEDFKAVSADLAGTTSYQWSPNWWTEIGLSQ